MPTMCPYVKCDFSTLDPGAYVTKGTGSQSAALLESCGLSVIAMGADNEMREVNVFDSSEMDVDDPDLGSPNEMCSPPGPGVGMGGEPTSYFSNCDPQGNLLIIQDPRVPDETDPNDSGFGGCFKFEFVVEFSLINMGLLDVEEPTSITVSLLSPSLKEGNPVLQSCFLTQSCALLSY